MLRKICNSLTMMIIIMLAALAVILIVPRLIGFQTLAVLSGSMEPNIPVGSIVFTKEAEPLELKAGDVVTYRLSADTMVTHRVVENDTESGCLIMQGDANETPDASPVSRCNVVGTAAWRLPLLGYLSIYIKTPLGIAAICGVLVVLILLTFLPEIFPGAEMENKSSGKRKKSETV